MKVRDFQRSKVYRSERKIEKGKVFPELKDVQKYCDRLLKSIWWKKNFPKVSEILVDDGRGRNSACGWRACSYRIRIKVPRSMRNQLIILHEISHGLATDKHGEDFCGVYIQLVRRFMSVQIAKSLQDSFDLNGVLYTEGKIRGWA